MGGIGLEDISQYDPYKDDTQNKQNFPKLLHEGETPTLETADIYLSTEVLLPNEDQIAKGCVAVWGRDVNENALGRAHTNLVFNRRQYQVEVLGGEIIELTANIIAESMDAQYHD